MVDLSDQVAPTDIEEGMRVGYVVKMQNNSLCVYLYIFVLRRLLCFKPTFCLFSSSSVDRNKYQIHIPLPPKIDPTVTMMQVRNQERKP